MKQAIKLAAVVVVCFELIILYMDDRTVIKPLLIRKDDPKNHSDDRTVTEPLLSSTMSLSTGSSGVRFSGEKVNVFAASNGAKLLSENSDTMKNQILFPSPNSKEEFGKKCDQWAVVTTIHVPNASIVGVSNLRSWCLVIIGDTITPDESYNDLASKENVFYLSAEYQKKFLTGNLFMEMMPFKSFARKNIGYLFAIQFDARVIYDFDDDNVLMPLEDGVSIPPPLFYFENDESSSSKRTVLLKFMDSTQQYDSLAFNPLIHMGASHQYSWPRGFPIDELQKNFLHGNLYTTEVGDLPLSSIGVMQSLCNGDPDTDAIFRMTRLNSTDLTFDRSAKSIPLLVPYSMYTPYNAQATTHLYNAFWGLYLPITVPGRVTDIWRSYITQRIMKDVGLHVIYTPPIVQHERSPHDYLADFNAENDLYLKTSKLLEFLSSWTSDATNLPERICELWIELYERNYIKSDDVEAAREWLNSLTMIGYKFPSLVDTNRKDTITIPQVQPSVEGQPYRSFPHFNVMGMDGNIGVSRPDSVVVKLILMTMNEWPILEDWLSYHGHLLGFENLYIVDSSTDSRCTSFLRYARDILGANVLFTNTNLVDMERLLTNIGKQIAGSSDMIIKVDTDELLAVYDNKTNMLSPNSIQEYLSGFVGNKTHPLHLNGNSKVGYVQGGFVKEEVCRDNLYPSLDKYLLDILDYVPVFKMVFDSKTLLTSNEMKINLGGHAHSVMNEDNRTQFGIVHYHQRCVEIQIKNARTVLERSNFISSSDTDEEAKVKLAAKFNCSSVDICNNCVFHQRFNSFHKAIMYLRYMDCEEEYRKEYYARTKGDGFKQNADLVHILQISNKRFKLS